MATLKQFEANRRNAQKSTGPKTPEGKSAVSMNALRHGLTGHTIILPSEDLKAYESHALAFFDEYQPKGATEKQHVTAAAPEAGKSSGTGAEISELRYELTVQPGQAKIPLQGLMQML